MNTVFLTSQSVDVHLCVIAFAWEGCQTDVIILSVCLLGNQIDRSTLSCSIPYLIKPTACIEQVYWFIAAQSVPHKDVLVISRGWFNFHEASVI